MEDCPGTNDQGTHSHESERWGESKYLCLLIGILIVSFWESTDGQMLTGPV